MKGKARTLFEAHGISEKRAQSLYDLVNDIKRQASESEQVQWAALIEREVKNEEERVWLTEQVFFKLGMLYERANKPQRVLVIGAPVKE